MICSADEAQLMRLLLQLIKAKKVIEIGEDGYSKCVVPENVHTPLLLIST